jgi:hypothetical protein
LVTLRSLAKLVVVVLAGFSSSLNGCFEAADTFSDSFSEFRKLFWSEDEQGNSDDN